MTIKSVVRVVRGRFTGNGARLTRGVTRGCLLASLSGTALVSAGEARANPLEICPIELVGEVESIPDSQSLRQATERAEAILATGLADLTAGDRALDELAKVSGSQGLNDAASLAAYCSASGEAMRLAREGSADRARSFLLGALVYSGDAGIATLQAETAYRLALVSASLPVRPNARSARQSRSPEAQAFNAATISRNADPDLFVESCFDLLQSDLSDQSNWAVATRALECAIDSAPALEQPGAIARSYLQLARVTLSEAEQRPAARAELRAKAAQSALAGLPSAARIIDPALRFEMLARLSETALDAGEYRDPALLTILTGIGGENLQDPAQKARRFAMLGRALLAEGRQGDAASYFRQAIYEESRAAQPLRMADWYLLLAEAEPANRARHVMQAYDALEAIRPLLPRFDNLTQESNFRLRMQPVFTAAVDVQLDTDASGAGDEQVLLAQRIVESFRQAEIQSAFGADCVPPRDPVSLADLNDGEMLLYPILLEDRVEILFAAKRAGQATQYRRITSSDGADRDRIEQLVKDATFSLGYGDDDLWQGDMAELYRLLIEPIENELVDGSSLIIIPDGILRRLPFAALRDSDGTLLIQKTQVSVSPSLAYTQPGNPDRGTPSVVAASLAKPVDLARGSFSELEGTEEEGDMAVGLGDPARDFGLHLKNFKAADLRTALSEQPVDILHLATHASFNGRSDRSFIVADGEAILLSELRDLLGSNQLRGELISLIILSACETALGDDQASMGLAGAAVQAGAESAVASLWEVDDEGTVALMSNFYRFYAEGQGKAEAMRSAQLELIGSDSRFADPRIWAAFTLLGAWR